MKTKILDNGHVQFTFEEGVPAYTFNPALAHQTCREYAVSLGFLNRLKDAAALSKKAENNYRITEAMRRKEVAELGAYYEGGASEWSVRVVGAKKAPTIPFIPAVQELAERLGCGYLEAYNKVMAKFANEFLEEMPAAEVVEVEAEEISDGEVLAKAEMLQIAG